MEVFLELAAHGTGRNVARWAVVVGVQIVKYVTDWISSSIYNLVSLSFGKLVDPCFRVVPNTEIHQIAGITKSNIIECVCLFIDIYIYYYITCIMRKSH